MSIANLLNQSASIYAKSGYNKYGRDTSSGSSTNVKCRFQNKTKTLKDRQGQIIELVGIAYFNGNASINAEDRVVIAGVNYKVFSVSGAIDGRGSQRMIKCELEKWQT